MAGEDVQPKKVYNLYLVSTFRLDFRFDKNVQFAYFGLTGRLLCMKKRRFYEVAKTFPKSQ